MRTSRASEVRNSFWLMTGILAVATSSTATANPDDESNLRLFESRVRPLLAERCYQCHSVRSGKSEGALLLDSREGIRKGGDRGLAVVPGKPEESLLLEAISGSDPDFVMPPKGDRVSKDLVRDVETWIRSGAHDPRDRPTDTVHEEHWALKKPGDVQFPDVSDRLWEVSPIDRFVLAQLEAAGLQPSPDAEVPTLLRRLYFDLIGLPPSMDDLDRFSKRNHAEGFEIAWGEEVDRLLASDRFGERWGRHWLDVARFAESSGKEANISFPYAWRYRDYVIDAVNDDIPFDRFLTEQIAGDLLPYDSDAERARMLIATGYLAVGAKNLDEMNPFQFLADVADEQIDAITRSVMATSVACARCHDHKTDPYSMEDYYALAGIFWSTKTYFGTAVSPANRVGGDPLLLPKAASQPILHRGVSGARVEKLKEEMAALKDEEKTKKAAMWKAIAEGRNPEGIFTLRDALRIFWRTGAIEGQLEKVDDSGAALALAIGVLERDETHNVHLLDGGDIKKPGNRVRRRFPDAISLDCEPPPDRQSGRLELARWLTHPDHPLTARVAVNRVWHHLFGSGLVATVDNFGVTGQPPSHPELLDFLAIRFVKNGWSLKKLVRDLVISRTYWQASTFRRDAFEQDPENRMLWRFSKRRLDAEVIRDAMLTASGDLDTTRPVGSLVGRIIGDKPVSLIGLDPRIPVDLDGTTHRSVYLPVLRDRLPDVLDLFDFAEPSLVTGDRETTNVPLQALYLMNSPFVHDRARSLAIRLTKASSEPDDQIRHAFRLCFTRVPDADELAMGRDFLATQAAEKNVDAEPSMVLVSFCQALLSTAEFRNLD